MRGKKIMAIYEVDYKFVDAQGRSTHRLLIIDAADEDEVITEADTQKDVLLGMSKCGIVSYDYRRRVAVNAAAAAGSNIDAGATFLWDTTLTINPTSQLPDPEEAAKDGQGGIDLAAGIVTAYTTSYTAGPWRLNRNVPTQPDAVLSGSLDK
jgi:hypothetical protein